MQTTPPAGPPPGPPPTSPPPPSRTDRRRRRRVGLVIAAAAILVLGGGASVGAVVLHEHREQVAAEKHRAEVKQKKAEQEAADREEEQRQAAARAEAQKDFDDLSAELEPLMSALTEVDARLNVGLDYGDYTAMIGDVAVAYAGMDIDRLVDLGGLDVGAKLESTYNKYNRAAQLWGDNLLDYDAVEPRMQDKWRSARTDLDKAKTMLADLEPSNDTDTGPSGSDDDV